MEQLYESIDIQTGSQSEVVDNKRKRDPNEDGASQLLTHLTVPTLPDTNNTVDVQKLLDVLQSFRANGIPENDGGEWSRAKRSKTEEVADLSHSPQAVTPRVLPSLSESLWQHVFGYVPPVFLGRLLRISRSFNAYLSTAKGSQMEPFSPSGQEAEPSAAEKVWIASRKRFCPGLPKPLHGLHELDMWRLLRGTRCQICDRYKRHVYTSDLDNSWEKGPECDGQRFVWPFGIRCCSPCLRKSCEKELTLRISPALDFPKDLIPALPFIFITSADHYLNIAALGDNERPPFLQFDKYYYKPYINTIKAFFDEVKVLGEGSTEEWLKGLPGLADAQLADYTRFEKWELKGGLKKVNTRNPSKSSSVTEATKTPSEPNGNGHEHVHLAFKSNGIDGQGSLIGGSSYIQHGAANASKSNVEHVENPSSIGSLGKSISLSSDSAHSNNQQERNIHDINDVRAARKAEIERRCAALSSPISPRVLLHMESFQAAMQISQPMTDNAWEILRPRLLAQRINAVKQERDHRLQDDYNGEDNNHTSEDLTETSEKNWEAHQIPVRDQIGIIADDFVADRWARGKHITKETAPQFAAETLSHVRERFYDQIELQDRAARAAGRPIRDDRPGEPPSRTLILENMKWIHDNKIKPRTDRFQSELFLCAGCPGNFKFYGFEGVVQHYAAKHTTSLSHGNSVVHWRAEWPEQPVYNPDPGTAKAAFYKIPTPAANSQLNPPVRENHQQVTHQGYTHPPPGHRTPVHHIPQPYHPPQPAYPADRSFHSPHPNNYYPNREYTHPNDLGFGAQPPPPTNGFMPPPPSYGPPPPPSNPYGHADYNTTYPSSTYSSSPHAPFYPPTAHYPPLAAPQQVPPHYGNHVGSSAGYNQPSLAQAQYAPDFPPQVRHYLGPGNPQPNHCTQDMELYKRQLDEMARHAREVWFATASIKDMPQSVRIFVVIHHTAARYAAAFNSEPTLAMFQDGLNNNSRMRPVRSLNGLGCSACVIDRRETELGHRPAVPVGIGDRRLFTLPLLLNHFRSQHVEPALASGSSVGPDWKREMIDLPEPRLIGNLIDAVGMDDAKLGLLAAVFPNAFPKPLPRVGSSNSLGPIPNYPGEHTNSGYFVENQSHPDQNEHHGFNNISRTSVNKQPQGNVGHSTAVEAPREDEYDPHRPASLQTIVKSEPTSARYGRRTGDDFAPDPLQELSRNLGSYQQEYHKSHSSLAAKDGSQHINHQRSSTSPSQAAERFLQELPIKKEVDRIESARTPSSWQGGKRAAQRDANTRELDGNDIMQALDRSLTRAPEPAQSYSPRTILNEGHQDDEYRPPSRIEAPSAAVKAQSISPQRSVLSQREIESTYRREPTEVHYVQDIYRGRESPALGVRSSVVRSRSRSPRPRYSTDNVIYDERPRDDLGQELYYRVASPLPREQTRSQRLVRYEDLSTDRYTYVEDHPPSEKPYRQQVQYVPVEVDRHGPPAHERYVYAQPVESHSRPAEYVRYEGAYQDQSVYEHSGQLYRTPTAQDPSVYSRAYRY